MSNFDVLVGQNKGRTFLDADPTYFTIDAQGQLTFNPLIVAAMNAAFNAIVPIGILLPSATETLPSATYWAWAEGGSLLRATYPALVAAYIVSRGAVAITEANPGVVTLNGHGFTTASCISLATTGTLPTNLAINTNYYVIYVNVNTFQLATSADNARAGTAINTAGAIQAGVHTLYSNPHGINGANSFYLPDTRAMIPKGYGDQAINTRTKSGLWIGAKHEDRGQGHWHDQYLAGVFGNKFYINAGGGAAAVNTVGSPGAAQLEIRAAIADGVNGTPRQGLTYQENCFGVRWMVRIL